MLWQPLLGKIAIFLAQSDESAARLREMGAERVETTGNVKYDAIPGRETALVNALKMRLQGDALAIVCGSTLEGEEAVILDAWPKLLAAVPSALLVIAPRHPDRFDQVALLVKERGFEALRGTTFLRTKTVVQPGGILLLDTIGDLATLYSVGSVAVVGGSLVHGGGHNPLEPARFGVPVVMGPSYENFREIVEAMREKDGILIVKPTDLEAVLIGVLRDREKARELGARGRAVSAAQAGASAKSAAALLKLLPESPLGRRHDSDGVRVPKNIASGQAGGREAGAGE